MARRRCDLCKGPITGRRADTVIIDDPFADEKRLGPLDPITERKAMERFLASSAMTDPPQFKVGERFPMPPRKLDIRPAWTGAGKPSFKPGRNGKR